MTTPFSSMVLVLIASFIGSFGAVCLKSGADRLEPGFFHMFRSWRIFLGVTLFLASSAFYIVGVRHGSLTVLYPLVSLGYMWTLIWSRLFFHEAFNRYKLFGLALILLGVFCIGFGNR
jgi:drug/metabolite transporter (DMT)-like permease